MTAPTVKIACRPARSRAENFEQKSLTVHIEHARRWNMGFSLAWLAVRGIPYEAVLDRQGLASTAKFGDYAESPLSAMPWGDWTLVVGRGCDHRIIGDANLARLSAGCEVVACSIEEHVMYSSSEFWSDGQRQWRVEHDAQHSIDHCSITGAVPEDYGPTRDHFAAQQEAEGGASADVDLYFEIPLVLAQTRVGFKHDEVNARDTDGKFSVLNEWARPQVSGTKTWWQFWK
jgi:hypothetical protein